MALGRKPIEIVNEGKHQLLTKAEHWGRIYLNEIATVQNGFAFSSSNFTKDEGLPLIRIRDIDKESTVDRYKGRYFEDFIVKKGDILIGMDGDFKAAHWKGVNALLNQRVCRIIPNSKNYDPKFLFICLQPYLDAINEETSSVTVKHLSSRTIEEIPLPFPPLSEQQAIISKIEELLSDLENGKQQLEKAQQQLTIYRKALIMDGVIGKLTTKWRAENPGADSSEKMFQKIQSQLDKSFKAASEESASNGKRKPKDQRRNKKTINVETDLPELPVNWNYYRLEDITYLVTDGTHFTPKYQESGIPFLSVKNVRPFYFRESHLKYISEEEHKSLIERCNPKKDDILYTKVGATYGYAAKVTLDYDFSIFVSLCLIKPVIEYFSSPFLEILMNSELVFKQARKRVSGSGVPDLHLIEIRDFKIPLPSLEEQVQIVKELESKLTICDKIEETINKSLHQSEILRQSILKKAFEGKLI